MKKIIHSEYAPMFMAALMLTVICAWFSMGAYYEDEHSMTFEFLNFKLGNNSVNNYTLPWEFYAKIKASLLPDVGYVFAKTLGLFGLYDPFTLAFLLRLATGVSSWFISCCFCLLFLPQFSTSAGKRFGVWICFFFWFIPYLSVRYTVENVAGILCLYGLYFILSIPEKSANYTIRYLAAGLLLGTSLFIRSSMIFAIAGFGLWLVVINKARWQYIFMLIIGGIAGIGINILLDHWYYGEWAITPYNYFYADIIQNRISVLGREPWWWYFSEFTIWALPPLGLTLLAFFFVGIYNNIKDPFTWIILPFLIAHCLLGHKELRFLFPVTFMFVFIAARGADYLLAKKNNHSLYNYIFLLFRVICIPALLIRTFCPAQVSMYYNKFLYNSNTCQNTPVFYIPSPGDDLHFGLNTSFYKKPGCQTILADSTSQIGEYLRNNKPQSALYFGYSAPAFNRTNYFGYKTDTAYSYLPDLITAYDSLLLKFHVNRWIEGTPNLTIYKFTALNSTPGFDLNKALSDTGELRNPDTLSLVMSAIHNLLVNDKLDEAETALATLSKNSANTIPHLHNYYGILYAKKNMAPEAEKEFNTEIELNQEKEEAYLNLGALYFKHKDYDNAVNSMINTLQINPGNAYACNNLGVYLLYIKKDNATALRYLEKAINIYHGWQYVNAYINIVNCVQKSPNRDKILAGWGFAGLNYRILNDTRPDPYSWIMKN